MANKTIKQTYDANPLATLTGSEILPLYNPLDITKSYASTMSTVKNYIQANIPYAPQTVITVGVTGSGADYECDGTDDHVQIQEALDEAGTYLVGAVVEVLDGHYNLEDILSMSGMTWFRGHGRSTVLDWSGWTAPHTLEATIVNGTDGDDFFKISDFHMIGYFTHGVSSYATGGLIGITISSADYVVVSDNYFEHFYLPTNVGSDNVYPYQDSAGASNVRNIIMRNNFVIDNVGALQGRAQENIIWEGNVFEDIADDCGAILAAQNNAPHAKNAVFVGNTFKNGRPQNDNGWYGVGTMFKVDGGGQGPETIENIIIADNVADGAEIGLYIANGRNVHIDNNIINGSYRSGIYLLGGNDNTYVTNNTIKDANSSSNGSHAGIFAVNADNLRISNNNVYGTTTGGKQGIDVEGTCNNVIINDNHIDSVSFFAIYAETCNNLTIHGNLLTGTFAKGIRFGGANVSMDNNSFFGTYTGSKLEQGTVSGVHIGYNNGLNPRNRYAQGDVTGATTFDRANGHIITATLTGNITVTLTAAAVAGDTLTLVLTQDGTGGWAATWPSNFKKASGTLTLSAAAGAVDVIEMIYDGTNWREVSRSMGLS